MSSGRSAAGRHWESVAARHLAEHGLVILERGYRCRLGELDIVCRDASTLVIVEVRSRATGAYVGALETVDARKRRKIVAAARHYLMRHPQWNERPVRFDVIAFDATNTDSPVLHWVRSAFDAA